MKSTSRAIPIPPSLAEERRPLSGLSRLDWGLLAATLLLAAVGLATVHSASAELPVDYLPRQALWVAAGLVLMAILIAIDYHTLIETSLPIYLGALALLVLVLFIGVGPGGTRSWLGIGGFRLGQPAELAKLATALLLARYLATADRRHLRMREILVAAAVAALPIGLVVAQPDYGSAAMFVPLVASMLLIAGVRLRHLAIGVALCLALGALTWGFGMKNYQRQRVVTFLSPDSDPQGAGYQVRQSKIAVGSGELTGKGYRQGTQSQLRFLPARHTDFVFAVLAEEWGFVGAAAVLGLYAAWILSALKIAMRSRDREGILLVAGLVSIFSVHVAYNTAMVVGFVPITGIPLPFLSYGGSFTLMNFAAAGLILSVDLRRYVNR